MLHLIRKFVNRLSLQTVLTIPFVIQVVTITSVVTYLSFKNSQFAVNDIASQLRTELTTRIIDQLDHIMEQPFIINEINALALQQGKINLLSGEGTSQLWQQAKIFTTTNLIYCGTENDGAFLGVGRTQGGIGKGLNIQIANPQTNRYVFNYNINPIGQKGLLESKSASVYDPRLRPWYETAKRNGQASWTEIYLDFETFAPSITATTPVYDQNTGQILGVCATDVLLYQELNTFLKSLRISSNGIAFIMDTSGQMVASSTPDLITSGSGEQTKMIKAKESTNEIIVGVSNNLEQRFKGLDRLISTQLDFVVADDRYYLETVRLKDERGLDWIIILAVPENDFMAQVKRNTRMTLWLCLVALLLAVVVGFLLTHWINKPIQELSLNARQLAQGHWEDMVAIDRSDVIGDLSRSLSLMAQQLKGSFEQLEERIEERTAELLKANQQLDKLAHSDGLTDVANRRYFDLYLDKLWVHLAQENKPLSLILCDVDYFKRYNDFYGHQNGDHCLQKIAQILTQAINNNDDLVARYGGEEFAILLPDTDTENAIKVAEHISKILENLNIPHQDGAIGRVTVSLGIGTLIPHLYQNHQMLIHGADQALYQAKAQGRNRYVVAQDYSRS
jgi:diguanylate cyclase (GGDEF)-like protein